MIFSICVFILTFILAKKRTGSTSAALAAASLAGAGSYYVANNTEWGREHLLALDEAVGLTSTTQTKTVTLPNGTVATIPEGAEVVYNADGSVRVDANGTPWYAYATDLAKSWGPAGVAGVVAASTLDLEKYAPWLIVAGLLFVLK